MADRQSRQASVFSDDEKAAFVQQVYEGVVAELARRTPTPEAELTQLRDDLTDIAGKLEQRLYRLETRGSTPAPEGVDLGSLLAALKTDRQVVQGLTVWAKRTQGKTRGALLDLVEALLAG